MAQKRKAPKKKAKKAPKKKAPSKTKKARKNKNQRDTMTQVLARHKEMVEDRSVLTPDQFNIFTFKRLFTGVIDIDLQLRPTIGKRICFIGKPSVGKTLTSHIFTAAAHRTCRYCFLPIIDWVNEETGEIKTRCRCGKNARMVAIHVDIEDSFDPVWAAKLGMHLEDQRYERDGYVFRKTKDDDLYVVLPKDGESAFRFAEDAVATGAADFVVIDSVAMVVPQADLTKKDGKAVGVSDERVGSRAQLVGRGLTRILNGQIRAKLDFDARPTIFWTNQFYSGPTKMPGQKADRPAAGIRAQHAADHIAHLIMAQKEKRTETVSRLGWRSVKILFQAEKSKAAGTAGGQGEYKVYLDTMRTQYGIVHAGSTDEPDRLLAYLSDLGHFKETGKTYECMGRSFTKVKDIADFLSRQDIQYMARYLIFQQLLPETAVAHLRREDYDYSPWGLDPYIASIEQASAPDRREPDAQGQGEDPGEDAEEDWNPIEEEEGE